MKVFEATCAAQVVTAETKPILGVTILSEGKALSSDGLLFMQGDKTYFIASSALDVKALITSLESIIQQIVVIATGLDAVTVAPGSAAASIAALTVLKTNLGLTKELLR